MFPDNNLDLQALRLTRFLLIKEHRCFDWVFLLDQLIAHVRWAYKALWTAIIIWSCQYMKRVQLQDQLLTKKLLGGWGDAECFAVNCLHKFQQWKFPGVNPIKIFTPQGIFTNASWSTKTLRKHKLLCVVMADTKSTPC